MEALDRIVIAGQFGAYLPADSLTGTGILPEGTEEKVEYVGNVSKTGAYLALMSERIKREIEELAKEIVCIELAELEDYERIFTESMTFPEFAKGNL